MNAPKGRQPRRTSAATSPALGVGPCQGGSALGVGPCQGGPVLRGEPCQGGSALGVGGGAVPSAMPLVGVVPLGIRATTPPPASAGPLAPGAGGGAGPGERMRLDGVVPRGGAEDGHAADARPPAPSQSSVVAGEGVPSGTGAVSSAAPVARPADPSAGAAAASGGPADGAAAGSATGEPSGGAEEFDQFDDEAGGSEGGGRSRAPGGADEADARAAAGGPEDEADEAGEDASAGGRARGGAGGAGDAGRGRADGPERADDVPHVLYVRFHPAPGEDVYQGLLTLLGELTPVVEALPPDAALADVRGALRYFGRDAAGLAEIVRVRALARYGVDCTVGVAANPMLARMAAQESDASGPEGGRSGRAAGSVRTVPGDPDAVAAFLARKPPTALPGVGPATARTLSAYGLDSAARIAAAPLSTLQRILGVATARRVHAWARGVDPAPVTPNAPARAMGAEHRFRHDELDPVRRRRALLTLADGLGVRLRTSGQVATALSLTVRYADRSTTTRSRTLTEPTAHTPALTTAAYALHDALGLQRARVRSVALRVEGLMDAELAPHQLTFDPADEKSRRLEAAADRARARFGDSAIRPAGFLDVA